MDRKFLSCTPLPRPVPPVSVEVSFVAEEPWDEARDTLPAPPPSDWEDDAA